MTLTVKETVKENLNSIGSLEEIKSVYYVYSEVSHCELNDDDEWEEKGSTQYDYYVYAGSFSESRDIVKEELDSYYYKLEEVNILEVQSIKDFDPKIHLRDFIQRIKIIGKDGNPISQVIGYRKIWL
jgi:hypothetical protein